MRVLVTGGARSGKSTYAEGLVGLRDVRRLRRGTPQATELDLFERVRDKNDAAARWLIAKDRIEWAVALAFATWWFTR